MSDTRFDIQNLHASYAKGLAVRDVVDTVFARIAAADDPGIFIHLADKASVIAQAEALGDFNPIAKPLWGVPCAVKDNIDVAEMPTTAACPAYAYTPQRDATAVGRLKAAGALVIGKTNLDQFATGLVGTRTPYPIPKNAIDPRLIPGGSSSGSAVAVSRGIVSFALGTDTAGSGRIPAGLNNIVGLKPTIGAVSTMGVVPACRTLDCVSIFALTVDDAYQVYSMAAGLDSEDPYSHTVAVHPLEAKPAALTLGVPARIDRKFFGDAAMEAGFDAALMLLQSLGCRIVELPFHDFYATANLLYEGAWVAERHVAIADFIEAHEAAMHPVTAKIIGGARSLSAADAFRGFYSLQASKIRLAPLIASVDLICVPTAPTHYMVDEVLADPIVTNNRLGTYTNFVNLLDLCGVTVPAGRRSDGLPMSVTLLASAGKDALVAELAEALRPASTDVLGATGWPLPPAPLRRPREVPAIEFAVVGAHLSGMPLNGELIAMDAKFCRAARTSASYRLYALARQSLPKPGLVRVSAGMGSSIEIEIWRLDPAAFGNFVAAIPSPLCVGSLELEDGSTCKGFLAETEGLQNATEISSYGGWRRYLGREDLSLEDVASGAEEVCMAFTTGCPIHSYPK